MAPKCTCATSKIFPHRHNKCALKKKSKTNEAEQEGAQQDLTSVIATSDDTYSRRPCTCATSKTFPHRVGNCVLKNIVHGTKGSPTNADAQHVSTSGSALIVNDTSSCTESDITVPMQVKAHKKLFFVSHFLF